LENKDKLLQLTPVMEKKLKHLTILTLATQKKTLPYDDLMNELDLKKNVRHLEDLIIEAIYAGKNHFLIGKSHYLIAHLIRTYQW
jgi:COP9 signalosome complex subunit 7